MAGKREVTFIITAVDRTRAAFRAVRRGLGRLKVGMLSLVGVGGFAALIRQTLNWASAIEGASGRLDITVERAQALKRLAEDSGQSWESLQGVMQRIARNAGQALGGDSRMAENFANLGISFKDLRNLSPDELFFKVADAAADTTRSWRETSALVAKIGDTEAVRFRALLVQGGDALRDAAEALEASGEVLDADALAKAAEKDRETAALLAKAQTEAANALVEALPLFTAVLEELNETIKAGKEVAADIQTREGQTIAVSGLASAGESVASLLRPGGVATAALSAIVSELGAIRDNTSRSGRLQ